MNDTVYSVILSPDLDVERAEILNPNGGVKIDVVNLSYSVEVGKGKERKEKQLLNNVSFSLEKGDMCALMGPSGAGKSTLLDLIADRKTVGKWSGEIYFNSEPRPRVLSGNSYAYVLQDDFHIATLTVAETIYYAAWTRLPKNTTKEQMHERVELLLEMMGLSHVRDSFIGDALHKGISGGQQKRLSIAVEIVSLPELIFLDEPTSGLDSSISLEIMKVVRELSNQNRTTVSTIHQPSPELFALFSKLVLVSGGRQIYFGSADEAVKYFSSPRMGYQYTEGQNPAEFIVDISGGKVPCKDGTKRQSGDMEILYKSSSIYKPPQDSNYFLNLAETTNNNLKLERCSSLTQFSMLLQRTWISKIRDTDDLKAVVIKSIGTALLVGIIFYGEGATSEPLYTNGVPNATVYSVNSLLYFSLMNALMSNIQVIPSLCNINHIYRREIAAGAYGTVPFWFAQLIATLPIQFIPFCLYFVLVYFLAGFPSEISYFVYFLSILFLANVASYYFAMYMAAATGSATLALAIFPLSFVFFANFAGFGVNINDLPIIWRYWAPYISYPRWVFQGLMVNQWETFATDDDAASLNGNGNVLSLYGFEGFNKYNAYWIILLFCAFHALLTLRALFPPKRKIVRVDKHSDELETAPLPLPPPTLIQTMSLTGSITTNALMRLATVDMSTPQPKDPMKGRRPQQGYTIEYYRSSSGVVGIATGCRLTFDNLTYSVDNPKDRHSKLKLLRGVSGFVNPGEMCALMGASGAGKSTLLDVLADRKNTGEIEGHIHFNGGERTAQIMKSSAYVMQDNVHIGLLTVKETITYAAELRLDENMKSEDKANRVQTILNMLGLNEVGDTLIGNENIRGVSGGQLKRVSIGVEIINLPDLMFFDEPTTGLDSAISFEVMAAVRNLANQNRTVICTIHQPSDDTFQLFDTLLLLAAGRVIYFGSVSSCVHYFTASVYQFAYQTGSNPADFVVAVAGSFIDSHDGKKISGEELADVYTSSNLGLHLQETIDKLVDRDSKRYASTASSSEKKKEKKADTGYNSSTLHQLKTLCHRSYILTMKSKGLLIAGVARHVISALFYGSLYYQMAGGTNPTAYSNREGLFYFALIFCMFGYQTEIAKLFQERLVFYRERGAKAYGAFPYWFSFWYLQLPISVINILLFCFIIYFLCGLRSDSFGTFYLVVLLNSLTGLFTCVLVAALTASQEAALSYMPLLFTFLMYFAGFAIYIPQMPVWLGTWAPYITFMRWSFQALVLNEFQDNDNLPYAQSYINNLGFDTYTKEECIPFIILYLAVFSLALLLALRFVNFEKR